MFSAATRRSHASAITAPAPSRCRFIAATTGFGKARMLPMSSPVMRVNCGKLRPLSAKSGPMISVTLPPLQKPRPSGEDHGAHRPSIAQGRMTSVSSR